MLLFRALLLLFILFIHFHSLKKTEIDLKNVLEVQQFCFSLLIEIKQLFFIKCQKKDKTTWSLYCTAGHWSIYSLIIGIDIGHWNTCISQSLIKNKQTTLSFRQFNSAGWWALSHALPEIIKKEEPHHQEETDMDVYCAIPYIILERAEALQQGGDSDVQHRAQTGIRLVSAHGSSWAIGLHRERWFDMIWPPSDTVWHGS